MLRSSTAMLPANQEHICTFPGAAAAAVAGGVVAGILVAALVAAGIIVCVVIFVRWKSQHYYPRSCKCYTAYTIVPYTARNILVCYILCFAGWLSH